MFTSVCITVSPSWFRYSFCIISGCRFSVSVTSIYFSCAITNRARLSISRLVINSIFCNSFAIFLNAFFCVCVRYAGAVTLSAAAFTSVFFRSAISAFVKCFLPFNATNSIGCLCPAMSRRPPFLLHLCQNLTHFPFSLSQKFPWGVFSKQKGIRDFC